jgi:hypothetical protein
MLQRLRLSGSLEGVISKDVLDEGVDSLEL